MKSNSKRRWIAISVGAVICTVTYGSVGRAQQAPPTEKKEEIEDPVFAAECDLMARTVVKVLDGETGRREAKRREHAIFRYGDVPQRLGNASIWVWEDKGRPVAIQKIEVNKHWTPPGWIYCFSALAESRVEVKWPNVTQTYVSKEPVAFKQIPGAPDPTPGPNPKPLWKQQTRLLSRQFTATMGRGRGLQQLRLLPKPILEYESKADGILAGSIFSLATGTNPSMFLMIELRDTDKGPRWFYGSARATSAPIQLKHLEVEVRAEGAVPRPAQLPTWTYVWLPRSPSLNDE